MEREKTKRILCPKCGRYVLLELYYAFHYLGQCLESPSLNDSPR